MRTAIGNIPLFSFVTRELDDVRDIVKRESDQDRNRENKGRLAQVDAVFSTTGVGTAEGYVHYVKGISSALDMESGDWTYDLQTHWLGIDPKTKWIFQPSQLNKATVSVLQAQLESQEKMFGPLRDIQDQP